MVGRFLADQPAVSGEDCQFEFISVPSKLKVPKSPHTLTLKKSKGFERKGRQKLELVIKGEKNLKRVISLGIFIRLFDSVWVAERRITRGSPINSQHIRKAYRDITRLAGVPVRRISELQNRLARQTITEGRVLTSRLIKLEPIVRQGESVNVVSRRNGILLTLQGIARQDGCLGQIIRVKSLLNHQVVKARVLENGRLELVSLATRG
jgi:flagella basal body P-ring formation protein FlgA